MLDHPRLRRLADRALGAVEGATVDRIRLTPQHPPLFVVGPPRCGTTSIFLTLVNELGLAFIPNVSKRHPRAPFAYALLSSLLGERYQPTLANRFGIVEQPMGPSDGWDVFRRWLPNAYPTRPPGPEVAELGTLVRLLEWLLDGPLCVRNNVNSLRIPLLDALFPGALFVGITRDWREAALSLADAYREFGTEPGAWWSAGPPDYDPAGFESPLEKAVFQILGVEAILRRDLTRLAAERCLLVRYEDFCADPDTVVEWAREAYARVGVRVRPAGQPPTLRAQRSSRRLAEESALATALSRHARAFLRGDYLCSEDVLSAPVRGLTGAAA